ncbi:MAG: hypothetical protein EOO04_28525 [Chitinophagaceae bacterium]|nr:MAG: hypothetical protein EOO04_28525 [Chitinophagaceae bacterium]
MKTGLVLLLAVFSIVFGGNDKLTGRWQTKPSEAGNVTGVVFMEDNTFEGFINKKPFVSGKFQVTDSIFSFTDNGCEGVRGTYKLIFFSNYDSLRFQTISDSCDRRRAGMERLIMGRVK